MVLPAAGVLGLAVLGALLTGSPGGGAGPGVMAQPIPDHLHVVHRGISPAALPRPLQPLVLPHPRRRVHILDPRTALNLVQAHESRRRRGSKRPPPYHRRGPPRPGPPRPPRWKGPPKRKGHGGPRDKPWSQQATRASSPAATRVRYREGTSKPSRKAKKPKPSKGKSRPQLPTYADGYAEDEDLDIREPEDAEPEEDRPRKKPAKSSAAAAGSKKQQLAQYPKGWGADGGYRVPAPPPQYPPYGPSPSDDEPGTGHLDLEERFINQHNQFYRHGYPADSAESAPTSTQSKRHKPGVTGAGLYEDEEIEVAEAMDDFADGLADGFAPTSHSNRQQQTYRRPSGGKTTRYSLSDGTLHEAEAEDSREDVYRRPTYSSKGRGKKNKHSDSKRHQSMYHAKFRDQDDDRTLSAANFNYELSGAASETAHTSVNSNTKGGNHRPAIDAADPAVTDVRTADANFFRTRKPQYWG